MSAVVAGLGAGALGSAGFGISAWVVHRRRNARAEFRRADRFAREVDLYLPPELVPGVAARVRRRMVFGLVLFALIMGPALGYLTGSIVAVATDAPAVGHVDFQTVSFPGASGFALILAPAIAITTLEGLWDLAHARQAIRTTDTGNRSTAVVRLRHALPVWLIWAARALSVLPGPVAAAGCAVQGRAGLAAGFAALAPLGWLLAWSVERLQLWMLTTGRPAARTDLLPQETAFDDAFRVTTALPLLLLAPCLTVLAGGFYIHLAAHGFWGQDLMLTWSLAMFPSMALNGALNTTWAKAYHHRPISGGAQRTLAH